MEKQIITFSANEQELIKTSGISNYSSNKVSYIEAHFDLGTNWSGYDSVRAIWYNDFNTIATVLNSLGECVVPYEVLTARGKVRVNIVGSISEDDVLTDRITSYPVHAFCVDAVAKVDGSNTEPITPSQFEQFAEAVRLDADRAEMGAESAETSAESAEASAESSTASAQASEASAIRASNSASDASASAQTAQEEAQKITSMEVVVTQLPEGATPTSDWSDGVLTIGIPKGDTGETGATGNGIESAVLNANYTLTLTFTDGTSYTTPSIRGATGATGATGNGISSVTLTSTSGAVKTYTIAFTDGTNTTFDVTDGEVTQAVLDETVSDLKAELDEFVDIVISPNFFTGYTEEGGLNNSTGEESASTSYVRSDYIPIDTSKSTIYILRQTAEWGMRIFFYNSSKTYLSNTQVFNGSATVKSGNCTIPENTAYIRTYRSASATGWVSFSYVAVTEYYTPNTIAYELKDEIIEAQNLSADVQSVLTDSEKIKTDLTIGKTVNFFDGTFPNSGYIDSDGSDISGSSYKRTDYIPIDDANSTLYFLRTAQPYLLGFFFYNSLKEGIGSRTSAFGVTGTDLKTSVSIPTGAAYIRMYTKLADYSGNLMLSYSNENAFVTYGNHFFLKDESVSENSLDSALKAKVNANLKLTGKTIAFMGDSIIGNFYDETGVCAILAEITGATVINCAFGGSRIAYRHGSNIQYTYWNALSGAGLADAIASGTWTDQDTAVANMTGGLAYFADRLATVKAVDWSKVDFIMWEYGTNDFMTEVALTGNDLYAYDYAYRHTIETILTEYPNIRIITATPTYRFYQEGGVFTDDSNTHEEDDYAGVSNKLTDFVAKAQEISKEYQIPCIDDYYTLGANSYTRLAFFNSTDGTHPKAEGRRRIAEHLSAQLVSLV